jgi:hypothetical protein
MEYRVHARDTIFPCLKKPAILPDNIDNAIYVPIMQSRQLIDIHLLLLRQAYLPVRSVADCNSHSNRFVITPTLSEDFY